MLADTALAGLPPWAGLGVLALAAMVAGIVNAMAGGGSLLTLPVLMALGLPPSVANGTNRVGVLVQSIGSTLTFHRRGVRPYGPLRRLLPPMMLGAVAGTVLATQLSDDWLRVIFGVMLAGWAVLLVFRPSRFLKPEGPSRPAGPGALGLAGLVGIYGGFLQAGVGFPTLALLVLLLGHDAVEANAIKVALVLAYTAISLGIFAYAGQVAWREGVALAVGGLVGGWLGTRLQIKAGAGLVRWVVVVAVAASSIAMLVGALG
ncbi:MAG: sulfite exporter TauE/SafE family protein [Myxococcales bacterium]|nr:sulfite exporter TauE/SafE family protein [Myxococcales bacterium]MCB9714590.1 sulfite exporter TauE/SafE family protein [Myxococcales bacterium]